MKNFRNDLLYPFLAFLALCVFLCAQPKAHETQSEALIAALHDCRMSPAFFTRECGTAVIKTANGEYRILPITIGDKESIGFTIRLSPGETIAALFHTHPGRDIRADSFSALDIGTAERLGVPSYIYVLRKGESRIYYPESPQADMAKIGKRVLSAQDSQLVDFQFRNLNEVRRAITLRLGIAHHLAALLQARQTEQLLLTHYQLPAIEVKQLRGS